MRVQPISAVDFKAAGQTYRIAASELKQQSPIKNSGGIQKDEAESWSVSFTASHAVGEFNWLVYYSSGVKGASLETFELVKQPAGVEILSLMDFVLLEGE